MQKIHFLQLIILEISCFFQILVTYESDKSCIRPDLPKANYLHNSGWHEMAKEHDCSSVIKIGGLNTAAKSNAVAKPGN